MVEFSVIPTEILQRPKKNNVIFEETITSRFISISVSIPAVTSASTFIVKTTTRTMKPVRQKLINEVKVKADLYRIILRILD